MPITRFDFGGLIFTVTRDFARLERNFCKVVGLYQGQPRILTILKSNEGVTLSELSPLCSIGLPSLSVSLRNLQKSGMIRKEGAGKNQRIYLTDLGQDHAMAFHQEIDAFFSKYLSTIGSDGQEQFIQYLQQFDHYIQDFNDTYKTQHGWKKD